MNFFVCALPAIGMDCSCSWFCILLFFMFNKDDIINMDNADHTQYTDVSIYNHQHSKSKRTLPLTITDVCFFRPPLIESTMKAQK